MHQPAPPLARADHWSAAFALIDWCENAYDANGAALGETHDEAHQPWPHWLGFPAPCRVSCAGGVFWDHPIGRRNFKMTPEYSAASKSLVANQGLYKVSITGFLLRACSGRFMQIGSI
jgi:hypothetical protein